MTQLARTPLFEAHRRLGARIVPFAGFEMPVQYGSILDEHRAVREAAGLFDVSHMGQLHVEGPRAVESVERLVTCPVSTLRPGRVRYGCLCNEEGGVVDDVTVYRLDADAFFLCVNAANIAKDRDWIESHTPPGAAVHDRSSETGLLALQGPASAPTLEGIAGPEVGKLRRFRFERLQLAGHDALVSRTGYTGSDGFELYLEARHTEEVFEALLRTGEPLGLRPAGLGARDTLRLEAALPLYGHELDDTTSPLEARLDRFVKLDAGGSSARRRSSGGGERATPGCWSGSSCSPVASPGRGTRSRPRATRRGSSPPEPPPPPSENASGSATFRRRSRPWEAASRWSFANGGSPHVSSPRRS